MSEPAFRQATKEDAEAVAAVGHQLWDELGERSGFTQRPTLEGIQGLISGGGAVFVCDTDGSICGIGILAPDLADPEEAVMGVWLLPEARRKGIGRELALMATDHARATGYKRLRGIIPEGNEPALGFFGDFGSIAQIVGQGMEYELPL